MENFSFKCSKMVKNALHLKKRAYRHAYMSKSKGPFKRMQHVGTTSSNIVGHNMLSSFKHHVGTCWAVLDRVGRCWMKFDFGQTFHPTSANIFLRACALVDIHWYPIYPRMSKRGHCDPRRPSFCLKSQALKDFIFDCRIIFYQRMW